MLMSVFAQNIVDMIVDYALWVAAIAILNLPLNLNRTMQFRFWTFLSHVIKTALS